MERPLFEALTKEQQAYIDTLEAAINGSTKLVKELNLLLDMIADEISDIRQGKKLTGKFFSNDKNDFMFERLMKLIGSQAAIKSISIKTPESENTKKSPRNIADMANKIMNGHENI